jgi:hypothetical protein
MSTHPTITYELAVAHDHNLIDRAAIDRRGIALRANTTPRSVRAGLGSLLIAAGERLGGIRTTAPRDLAGAAR